MKKVKDLTGKFYNGIEVIYRDFEQEIIKKDCFIYWKCRCHCGNYFSARGNNLKNGNTKSCGCLQKEIQSANGKKNGKQNNWVFQNDVVIGITFKNQEFYIDKDEYEKVKEYRWRFNKQGYVVANSKNCTNKIVKIQNVIMNPLKEKLIDHKDGNKADNRKFNLRTCTKSQNNMNIKLKSNNTSGFNGVKQNKRTGKWVAQININNKRIHLGTYINFEDAVLARSRANKKYHKEFSGSKIRNEADFIENMNMEEADSNE